MLEELAQRYGPTLLVAGIVYTLLVLSLQVSIEAGGAKLSTSLVPDILVKILQKTISAWNNIAQYLQGGEISALDIPFILYNVTLAIVNSILAVLATLVAAVLSFILIAAYVTRMLPYPFSIISVFVWIAAGFAEIILISYVVNKMYEMFTKLTGIASGLRYTYT